MAPARFTGGALSDILCKERMSKESGNHKNQEQKKNTDNRRRRGSLGEELAASFLAQHGVRILARNFRSGRSGEIDLVAREGDVLLFIEVKMRRNAASGAPEEAITYAKQRTICRTADYYRCRYRIPEETPIRFDAVAIRVQSDHTAHIRWIRNAFPYHI